MDSFSSPPTGLGSPQISPHQVKEGLQQALAQQYLEVFVEVVREKCFEKCVKKPGSSLSGSEASCISRCFDRYIKATGIVLIDTLKPLVLLAELC